MRRRLLRTAAIMTAAMLLFAYAYMAVTDSAFEEYEASQLAETFARLEPGVAEQLIDGRTVDPADYDNHVREGEVYVYYHQVRGYIVALEREDGTQVELTTLYIGWLPGSTGPTLLLLIVMFALAAALAISWPLVRRVGALERVVSGFSSDLSVRAEAKGHDEVASLARHFNEMAERVEGQVETQRALVQAIAHEYRTPLARARLATELIVEARDEGDRELQVGRLRGALDDLEALADEVRFFARASAPVLAQTEPIELRPVFDSLLGTLALPPDVELELDVEPGERVSGDPRLLRRVLANLLANALRHAHGTVRVALERGAGRVCLYVDDDGPGVPAAERERVFEPFVRLDAARSGAGGYGLGLAIAARMAAAQGGRAWVGDAPLGGARFVLELPESSS